MSTVETTIGRFGWHDHRSPDPQAAQRFYTELLGWELEVFPMGEFDYPMIKANDQTHGGFGPVQGDEPAGWLGSIVTDDVDAATQRVAAAGGTVQSEPVDIPEVGRWSVVADPQGAVFALFQAVGDPPTSEGVFVWDELGTADIEGAKSFYAEVAGWESSDQDMGGGFLYTIFRSNGVDRAGAYQRQADMPGSPGWLPYVATGDVDASLEKAASLGATTITEPMDIPTVGRMAIVADPTGAAIGLYKPEES
jgi:predicted enzyme related to lactoylglutathione lyase